MQSSHQDTKDTKESQIIIKTVSGLKPKEPYFQNFLVALVPWWPKSFTSIDLWMMGNRLESITVRCCGGFGWSVYEVARHMTAAKSNRW